MTIRTTSIMLLIFLLAVQAFTHAQNSSELMTWGDRIVSYIQPLRPDWKYENVHPISESTNVIVQQWTLNNRSVRIAIIAHKSTPDAEVAISKLAREGQLNERIQGLADEGITWGRGVVSFRKRNFTIDVSATDTQPILDTGELIKSATEERRLAKEFAALVANGIKDKQ